MCGCECEGFFWQWPSIFSFTASFLHHKPNYWVFASSLQCDLIPCCIPFCTHTSHLQVKFCLLLHHEINTDSFSVCVTHTLIKKLSIDKNRTEHKTKLMEFSHTRKHTHTPHTYEKVYIGIKLMLFVERRRNSFRRNIMYTSVLTVVCWTSNDRLLLWFVSIERCKCNLRYIVRNAISLFSLLASVSFLSLCVRNFDSVEFS